MEHWAGTGETVAGGVTQTWMQLCGTGRGRAGWSVTEQLCRAEWEVSEGPGPETETPQGSKRDE